VQAHKAQLRGPAHAMRDSVDLESAIDLCINNAIL
jgi:hypothetical protein